MGPKLRHDFRLIHQHYTAYELNARETLQRYRLEGTKKEKKTTNIRQISRIFEEVMSKYRMRSFSRYPRLAKLQAEIYELTSGLSIFN